MGISGIDAAWVRKASDEISVLTWTSVPPQVGHATSGAVSLMSRAIRFVRCLEPVALPCFANCSASSPSGLQVRRRLFNPLSPARGAYGNGVEPLRGFRGEHLPY